MSNTYCYEYDCGLTAEQLWWLIATETLMEEFGLDDILAATAIVSGANIVPTRAKPSGAVPRTSLASLLARRLSRKRNLPFRVPTLTGFFPPNIRMTSKAGAVFGRAIPVVGWAYTAYELTSVAIKTLKKYNAIVKPEDQAF
ncbi:STM2901 family protein [Pseudomonas sp. NPDC090203]|uniref:STM2901 family protein n=1 Tax=Pseudomonas sp. NPDC090203 TaxID=3364477 RepID=UPI00380AD132